MRRLTFLAFAFSAALFSKPASAERIAFTIKPSNHVAASIASAAGFKRCVRQNLDVFNQKICAIWGPLDSSAPQEIERGNYCVLVRWAGSNGARHRSYLQADVGTPTQVRVYQVQANQRDGVIC